MPSYRNFLAKTNYGLEEVLAKELKALGARNIVPLNRAVSFKGNKVLLYKANLWLRTALRVLLPIAEFRCRNEHELYQQVSKIQWAYYLDETGTLAVDAASSSPNFTHTKYVAQKVKDAIVDQFRAKTGRRPSVDLDNPTVRINTHIRHNTCTISLDSSNMSLHMRGYRSQAVRAPLNEVLAAGMVLLSGYSGAETFVDSMCGSGTLLVEAALVAANMAPGMFRQNFGFMNWKDFEPALWEKLKQEARDGVRVPRMPILGSDLSAKAVSYAAKNCQNAGVGEFVAVVKADFAQWQPPEGNGIVIINPPYDLRIKKDDIVAFYKMIGNQLKHNYRGYDVWLLSSNTDGIKSIGLKPSKKLTLYNGQLACKFLKFDIYYGSRK